MHYSIIFLGKTLLYIIISYFDIEYIPVIIHAERMMLTLDIDPELLFDESSVTNGRS